MSLAFKAIVLAAGMGTRMKSRTPKVLHQVLGLPMVMHPVRVAEACGAEEVALVVGHGRDAVEDAVRASARGAVSFHVQAQMLGTADAVKAAHAAFNDYDGAILILYGDVPNLPLDVVQSVIDLHRQGASPITMLTAINNDGGAYGRIVRDAKGRAHRIVEHKDADQAIRAIREINVGVYLVDAPFLRDGLAQLDSANAQNEFYLTDLVEMAYAAGRPAQVVIGPDIEALHGVNTRAQLARAERYARARLNEQHMLSGVTMIDPATTYIDLDATIGQDVLIEPGAMILGASVIGDGAVIGQGARVERATVAAGTHVTPRTTVR